MKKIIFMLFISIGAMAQETIFKFDKDGFTDFIVVPVDGKPQAELYKKTIEWINVNYNSPKEVIKAQIENDYIRIEGSSKCLVRSFLLNGCYDTRYQVEISFKENKYKFDLIKIEYYIEPNKYSNGGWVDYNLIDVKPYFKSSGEIKIRYKNEYESFPKYFNDLNAELLKYILSNETSTKKSDW